MLLFVIICISLLLAGWLAYLTYRSSQDISTVKGDQGPVGRDGSIGKDAVPCLPCRDGIPGARGEQGPIGPPGSNGLPGDQGIQGPMVKPNTGTAIFTTSIITVTSYINYSYSDVSNTVVFHFVTPQNVQPGESFDVASVYLPGFISLPKVPMVVGSCFSNNGNYTAGQLSFGARISVILKAPINTDAPAMLSILNIESGITLNMGEHVYGTINWAII